ncbi:MAG: GTP-binding protein, partial [Methylobacter sp.]|nr:GTP-binding protein [Methylobacter sp.]
KAYLTPHVLLSFPKKLSRLRDTELSNLPDHGFSSITLQLEHRLPWERLQKALDYLIARYPKQLVRLKGMVYTLEQNQPLLGARGSWKALFYNAATGKNF